MFDQAAEEARRAEQDRNRAVDQGDAELRELYRAQAITYYREDEEQAEQK